MQHIENEKDVEGVLKEIGIDRLASAGIAQTGNIAPARKFSDYLKASVGWVYACVNAISDEIGQIQIKLYRQKGKEAVEVLEHPALDLLYKCNSFTTKFDFFSTIAQYLELTGEAPFYVSFLNGKPDSMIVLRPDKLSVKQGTQGNIINGYEYELGLGSRITLEVDEVVFLRYPDPNKPFRGLGTLQAVARTVDIDEYSEEYNKQFFFNSARPDSALETDQKLNEKQLQSITKKFEAKYKGLDNSHKTIILQGGLKYKPISLTQKDMDFMEQQKFSRDKILGIFRVPRTVLGITDDVNRANAEATDYVFAKRTIKPKLERIIQQLNEFYLPMFKGTDLMYLDYESPVPEDAVSEREDIRLGLQEGFMTINEAREEMGESPVGPEGDKLRLPMGRVEIDTYDDPVDYSPQQYSISRDRANAMAKRVKKAQRTEILAKTIEQTIKDVLVGDNKPSDEKPPEVIKPEITDEEKKEFEFQNKQLSVADSYIPKFQSKFQNIFEEQQKEVLAKLNKKELNPKDFLLLPSKEKKRYIRHLAETFSVMIIAQSKEAYKFIGIDNEFSSTNPAITDYLKNYAFKFSTPVTKETNRRLSEELLEGINAGEGIAKLKKRVEGIFSDMAGTRAELIARSETIRATNYSAEQTYIQSNVVEGKRWLTAIDDRTCEWCDEMNGTVQGLGETFVDKGSSFVGRDGGVLNADYEDVEHPPLHPACRCTLIPIISKAAVVPEQKQDIEKEKEIISKLDSILSNISNEEGK